MEKKTTKHRGEVGGKEMEERLCSEIPLVQKNSKTCPNKKVKETGGQGKQPTKNGRGKGEIKGIRSQLSKSTNNIDGQEKKNESQSIAKGREKLGSRLLLSEKNLRGKIPKCKNVAPPKN